MRSCCSYIIIVHEVGGDVRDNPIPITNNENFFTASASKGWVAQSVGIQNLEPNVDRDNSPVFDRLNATITTDSKRTVSKLPSVIRKGLKRHRLLREYAIVTLESGDSDFTASTTGRCYDTKPL